MVKQSVASAMQIDTSSATKTGDDDRMSIRGISAEARIKLNKGAKDAHKSHGQWATEAFEEKFARERAGLPAVIVGAAGAASEVEVTGLVPQKQSGMTVETDHLAVLQTVLRYTAVDMAASVRREADRVAIDRLRLLRMPRPRRKNGEQEAHPG